jgi:VanZ family protein
LEPKKTYYLLLALSWTTLITWLSLGSTGSFGQSIPVPQKDKVVHFCFYFGFVFWWGSYLRKKTKRTLIGLWLAAVGYGIIMEVCQLAFTQNRSADLWDVLANTIGASVGLWVFSLKK